MAVILEGGCRVSEMREGEPVISGTLSIWNQIGRATGAQAISLRVMEFTPGLSPTIRNDNCDQILYVLDSSLMSRDHDREAVKDSSQGQAQSAPPLDHSLLSSSHPERVRSNHAAQLCIDGHGHKIGADTGIYIRPNQTFAIENHGPDSIVVISVQCPDPDSAPRFVKPAMASDSSPLDRAPLVRLADQRAQPTADRWYRVLVDDRIGSDQVTQFVGSIPPGRAPDHFHQYEEVLFILKGEGRMWAGETKTPVGVGSCIYLPKGQVHCVENTGTGELRLLGVFYPAGSPSVRYDV
jgi:mannose-6-phosphate isomerase-like protein (cupin superfamily)